LPAQGPYSMASGTEVEPASTRGRRLFRSKYGYWYFFFNPASTSYYGQMKYTKSADGQNWDAPVTFWVPWFDNWQLNWDVDFDYDNDKFHVYVITVASDAVGYYRQGTITSGNPVISWGTVRTASASPSRSGVGVTYTSDGYPFITYRYTDGFYYRKATALDGSAWGTAVIWVSYTYGYSRCVRMPNGAVMLVWVKDYSLYLPVYRRRFNGTGLDSGYSSSNDCWEGYVSPVSSFANDWIYHSYVRDYAGARHHTLAIYKQGTGWLTEETIRSNDSTWSRITEDAGDIYAFRVSSSALYRRKRFANGTWEDEETWKSGLSGVDNLRFHVLEIERASYQGMVFKDSVGAKFCFELYVPSGSKNLSCQATIRNQSSKNLSCQADFYTHQIPCSAVIRNIGARNLSSSMTIRKSSSKNCSAQVDVYNIKEQGVQIQGPTNPDTTAIEYGVELVRQQKNYYYPDPIERFWIFYDMAWQGLSYRQSKDGINWSDRTLVFPKNPEGSGRSSWYDVWRKGNVFVMGQCSDWDWAGPLRFRRGVASGDGALTLDAVVNLGISSGPVGVSVCIDSDGYPWIAFSNGFPTINGTQAMKANNQEGTSWPSPTMLHSSVLGWTRLVPLNGGKVLCIYCYQTNGTNYLKARRWNGSSWDNVEDIAVIGTDTNAYSAVPEGEVVHIIYGATPTYRRRNADGSYESGIALGPGSSSYPGIHIDRATGDLHAYWSHLANKRVYMAKFTKKTGTWSSYYLPFGGLLTDYHSQQALQGTFEGIRFIFAWQTSDDKIWVSWMDLNPPYRIDQVVTFLAEGAHLPCSAIIRNKGIRNLSCNFYSLLANKDQKGTVTPQITGYKDQLVSVTPRILHKDQVVSLNSQQIFSKNLSCQFDIPKFELDQGVTLYAKYEWKHYQARITPALPENKDQIVSLLITSFAKNLSSSALIRNPNLPCSLLIPYRAWKDQQGTLNAFFTFKDQNVKVAPEVIAHKDQEVQVTVSIFGDQVAQIFVVPVVDKPVTLLVEGSLNFGQDDQICQLDTSRIFYVDSQMWTETYKDFRARVHIPSKDLPCKVAIHRPWKELSCFTKIVHSKALSCSANVYHTKKDLSCSCDINKGVDFPCSIVIPIKERELDRGITFYALLVGTEQNVAITPQFTFNHAESKILPRFDGNYSDQGVGVLVIPRYNDIGVSVSPLHPHYKWPPLKMLAVIRNPFEIDLSCSAYIPPRDSKDLPSTCVIRQSVGYVDISTQEGRGP